MVQTVLTSSIRYCIMMHQTHRPYSNLAKVRTMYLYGYDTIYGVNPKIAPYYGILARFHLAPLPHVQWYS